MTGVKTTEMTDQAAAIFTTDAGKSYSYWRLRILYSTIIGYAAYYLVRQNLSMALPGLREAYGYSLTEIGYISSTFAIVYGVGKFFNGYLSDRSNARYFMAFGLLGAAAVSALMGVGTGLIFFGVCWAVNGWFQSMGFPPTARLLTHWFSPRELGTKWSIWSCSHQLGSAASVILAGFLVSQYGWQSAFFIPSLIAALFSLFLLNRLRDTPKKVGLPSVELYKNDTKNVLPNEDQKVTMREVLEIVLKNRLVWYISLANLFLYIPRMGILNWAPTFLKEFKGASLLLAGGQVAAFDVAGLVGAVTAGWLSDKYFGARRGPVGTLYLLCLTIAFLMLWKVPAGYPYLDSIALILAGFFIAGPQVLVGIALADFASKRAVGVANGFAGIMGYVIGACISGVGVGKVVDMWGWNGGFILFVVCALIGAFFFSLTWNARAKIVGDNFQPSHVSTK